MMVFITSCTTLGVSPWLGSSIRTSKILCAPRLFAGYQRALCRFRGPGKTSLTFKSPAMVLNVS